jgi:hypothetical protein
MNISRPVSKSLRKNGHISRPINKVKDSMDYDVWSVFRKDYEAGI